MTSTKSGSMKSINVGSDGLLHWHIRFLLWAKKGICQRIIGRPFLVCRLAKKGKKPNQMIQSIGRIIYRTI